MATTSLWHIKGRLGDLIDYVENPEKTVPKGTEDFFNIFEYVRRPDKTTDQYVDAINCRKEIALQQMILTKKQYSKNDKYIAWHGYQSFKVGEVTPDVAHEIGMKLANEMWGDRFQIVVTTHLDKDHIHNHFAFNSVSFRDGGKYNYSKSEQQRLRDTSDRLCREYELSVIAHPHKAPSRPVWLDEKSGKPTRYNVYRKDITAAFSESTTVQNAEKYLQRLGYITDFSGAHWKIRLPQYEHFTRLDTLEERWTPEYLREHIGQRAPNGNRKPKVKFTPYMPYEYRGCYTPFRRTSQIYKLFVYYCFQLGIYPEREYYEPTSPYLREDLRKLDEYTAQTDYLEQHHIQRIEDLYTDRAALESRLNGLTAQRTKLQNKIRRAAPEEKEVLRREKSKLTTEIAEVRKSLKYNRAIEERSVHIQDTLDRVAANEARAEGREVPQQTTYEETNVTTKKEERNDER